MKYTLTSVSILAAIGLENTIF